MTEEDNNSFGPIDERSMTAIEAPISRHSRNSLIIGIVFLVGFGLYCIYDGFCNDTFIQKHTEDGKPNSTLLFNQKSPPYLFLIAAVLGIRLFLIRKRRLVADETGLTINDKLRIPYDSIQQIDKTHFEKKGFFDVTYTQEGRERHRRLDGRTYDNIRPILDHLVQQIS